MSAAPFLLWLAAAVAFDFGQRRVPNWLVLVGIGAALGALVPGTSALGVDLGDAALGASATFILLLTFHAAGLVGAGDVKFGAVLGLWVGLEPLATIGAAASLMAGVHALIWLVFGLLPAPPSSGASAPLGAVGAVGDALRQVHAQPAARQIPYAAYLALAAMGWIACALAGMPEPSLFSLTR